MGSRRLRRLQDQAETLRKEVTQGQDSLYGDSPETGTREALSPEKIISQEEESKDNMTKALSPQGSRYPARALRVSPEKIISQEEESKDNMTKALSPEGGRYPARALAVLARRMVRGPYDSSQNSQILPSSPEPEEETSSPKVPVANACSMTASRIEELEASEDRNRFQMEALMSLLKSKEVEIIQANEENTRNKQRLKDAEAAEARALAQVYHLEDELKLQKAHAWPTLGDQDLLESQLVHERRQVERLRAELAVHRENVVQPVQIQTDLIDLLESQLAQERGTVENLHGELALERENAELFRKEHSGGDPQRNQLDSKLANETHIQQVLEPDFIDILESQLAQERRSVEKLHVELAGERENSKQLHEQQSNVDAQLAQERRAVEHLHAQLALERENSEQLCELQLAQERRAVKNLHAELAAERELQSASQNLEAKTSEAQNAHVQDLESQLLKKSTMVENLKAELAVDRENLQRLCNEPIGWGVQQKQLEAASAKDNCAQHILEPDFMFLESQLARERRLVNDLHEELAVEKENCERLRKQQSSGDLQQKLKVGTIAKDTHVPHCLETQFADIPVSVATLGRVVEKLRAELVVEKENAEHLSKQNLDSVTKISNITKLQEELVSEQRLNEELNVAQLEDSQKWQQQMEHFMPDVERLRAELAVERDNAEQVLKQQSGIEPDHQQLEAKISNLQNELSCEKRLSEKLSMTQHDEQRINQIMPEFEKLQTKVAKLHAELEEKSLQNEELQNALIEDSQRWQRHIEHITPETHVQDLLQSQLLQERSAVERLRKELAVERTNVELLQKSFGEPQQKQLEERIVELQDELSNEQQQKQQLRIANIEDSQQLQRRVQQITAELDQEKKLRESFVARLMESRDQAQKEAKQVKHALETNAQTTSTSAQVFNGLLFSASTYPCSRSRSGSPQQATHEYLRVQTKTGSPSRQALVNCSSDNFSGPDPTPGVMNPSSPSPGPRQISSSSRMVSPSDAFSPSLGCRPTRISSRVVSPPASFSPSLGSRQTGVSSQTMSPPRPIQHPTGTVQKESHAYVITTTGKREKIPIQVVNAQISSPRHSLGAKLSTPRPNGSAAVFFRASSPSAGGQYVSPPRIRASTPARMERTSNFCDTLVCSRSYISPQ